MLKKICQSFIPVLFLIAILFLGSFSTDALVKGWTAPEEQSSSNSVNADNSLERIILPSEENPNVEDETTISEMNRGDYPDLGSDQVFPFVAGLDSYQ